MITYHSVRCYKTDNKSLICDENLVLQIPVVTAHNCTICGLPHRQRRVLRRAPVLEAWATGADSAQHRRPDPPIGVRIAHTPRGGLGSGTAGVEAEDGGA